MKVETYSWHQNYPLDVPKGINAHRYTNLVDLFRYCIVQYGPLPAFDCMGSSISYN